MAVKNYVWGAGVTIESGGFDGEKITISDGTQTKPYTNHTSDPKPTTFWFDEHTSTSETGSATYTYTYQDLDFPVAFLSEVALTIRDSWTVSVNPVTNKMRITVETTFVSGSRTLTSSGTPSTPLTWWHIIKRSAGGQSLIPDFTDSSRTSHPMSELSNKNLGQYTYELSPGTSTSQASVWYRNVTDGYQTLPWPNIYTDIFGIGIHFKNILPPPTTYKIIYDANGGSGAPMQQTASTAEGSYTFTVSSGTPTWGSYKFLGWSRTQYSRTCTDADVEYRAGDVITLQEANPTLTLYACWEKDYRPGQIIDNNGIWQSHNRPTGADNVYTGSSWNTMRTIDGAVGTDNPPYMRHTSEWKNQRKIGNNA